MNVGVGKEREEKKWLKFEETKDFKKKKGSLICKGKIFIDQKEKNVIIDK